MGIICSDIILQQKGKRFLIFSAIYESCGQKIGKIDQLWIKLRKLKYSICLFYIINHDKMNVIKHYIGGVFNALLL